MPLTDTAIRSTKPDAKPKRLFDGGGLYLEVSPTGGKLWRLRSLRTGARALALNRAHVA